MKNIYKKLFALLLAIMMVLSITACGKKSDGSSEQSGEVVEGEEQYSEDRPAEELNYYDEEELDSSEIKTELKDDSKYCGTWTSDSANSAEYYDTLEITVKKDGTWSGDITGEKLSGTWTKDDTGLALSSDIFDCKLVFASTGNLLLQEDLGDGEIVSTVLKKK